MPVRTAEARWQRSLQDGSGTMRLGSGAFEGNYSFKSRMEEGAGTNPEELIGAAHAGCFSMAFANGLTQAGHKPQEIRTTASVHFDKTEQGWAITRIDLATEGNVPDIDEASFKRIAEEAKQGCPVSKALAATPISLKATLKTGVTA
ncbi:MAG: OsmC family protein [Chloroflexi bacterium]|nr:MAG: OsmC family protein [Chloroflexota bacterium]TMD68323.1 MAG: OsmC family protein [Chloroflexota bacterium]